MPRWNNENMFLTEFAAYIPRGFYLCSPLVPFLCSNLLPTHLSSILGQCRYKLLFVAEYMVFEAVMGVFSLRTVRPLAC